MYDFDGEIPDFYGGNCGAPGKIAKALSLPKAFGGDSMATEGSKSSQNLRINLWFPLGFLILVIEDPSQSPGACAHSGSH
jgi:hypothetical protein